jgi:hypothetical protein
VLELLRCAALSTRPAQSSVPLSRGIIVHSLSLTVLDVWGDDGMRAVAAHLPSDIAAETIGPNFLAIRWYPSSHLVAWHNAIFEGPAKHDERAFTTCIQRSLDHSTGLLRRALMRFLTPDVLAEKTGELWDTFHTHGKVVVESKTDVSARILISEHPFVDDEVSRRVLAIMTRHMLSRSRAKNVRESHELRSPGHLTIEATWTR